MLAVTILIIISLMSSVWMINDTIPEIPSYLLSRTNLLPERSESTISNLSFQEYIPLACFCNELKCNAKVGSIKPPVLGLFTRDGKIVKSLNIEANKGELMYIILIDRNSDIGSGTYLERVLYWRIIDSQHQLLAGAPLDFEIRQQLSVKVIGENNLQFPIELETKNIVISAFEKTTGLSISTPEQSDSKTNYHYTASPYSQVVGVYQLVQELTIHPSVSLVNYVREQKTGARCPYLIVFNPACGFVQLLPSFLQRTPIFRQASVSLPTTISTIVSTDTSTQIKEKLETTIENLQTPITKTPSKARKAIIIPIVCTVLFFVVFGVASLCYFKNPFIRRRLQPVPVLLLIDPADDTQDL